MLLRQFQLGNNLSMHSEENIDFPWKKLRNWRVLQRILKADTQEKSYHPVFINMSLVLLLVACTSSPVDNFPYKYMSCLRSLI